jgi:DNA-binding CsgD family transcriptional regulator
VISLNNAASALLGQDLQVKKGEIVSFSRAATNELARAVHSMLRPDVSIRAPAVVALPRRHGRPFMAMLTRPSKGMFDAVGKCRCIISLVDLNTSGEVERDLMKSALGLTNAEVRLANQLSEGMGISETAASLGISYETARGHLKSIYNKLGVGGRAELSKLISKIRERIIFTDE